MPTYQTTPYIPWTFPDEAVSRNHEGVQPLKAVPCRAPTYMSHPTSASEHFRENAMAEAYARIRNTSLAKAGMLGLRNTTARSQRYDLPASRADVPNGRFMAPAYQYAADAGQKRGGTGLITYDGRRWVQQAIARRIQQLDAIETGSFLPKAKPIDVNPETNTLDGLLQPIIDVLQADYIPTSLIEMGNKVQAAIIQVGATLRESDLVRIYRVIQDAQVSVRSLLSSRSNPPQRAVNLRGPAFKESDDTKILKIFQKSLDRMERMLVEILKTANAPKPVRQAAVNAIARAVGESISSFLPPPQTAEQDDVQAAVQSTLEDRQKAKALKETSARDRTFIRVQIANEATQAAKKRLMAEYASLYGIPSTVIAYIVAHPEMDPGSMPPLALIDPEAEAAMVSEAMAGMPRLESSLNLAPMAFSNQYAPALAPGELPEGEEAELGEGEAVPQGIGEGRPRFRRRGRGCGCAY